MFKSSFICFSFWALFILFTVNGFSKSTNDSLITSIVSGVNADSVRYTIQNLQNFQTRFMLNDNHFLIADWLFDRFASLGINDIQRDSFFCNTNYGGGSTTLQVNIVATIPGQTKPEEVYIIGGHYDSYAYGSPLTNAPGADDNASGTTAVLEFARIIMESGFQPEATIKFIAFSSEELMLFGDAGCEHYAQQAYNDGMNIKLMINCDMISHNTRPLAEGKVSINYYSGFTHLLTLAKNVTNQFSQITGVDGSLNQYSDSYPFYEKGFAAIYFEEEQFSPYYHTVNDIISNYDISYCSEVIKSAGALLLKYMYLNSPSDISEVDELISDFILHQNYPNPFNPTTSIQYAVSSQQFVSLKVYDALGNEIATLVDEEKPAGRYEVEFETSSGIRHLASGIYFYQLKVGSFVDTKKMILLR